MPKQSTAPWTLQQQLRLEALIEDHERRGINAVRWGNYTEELGHPINSCYVEAQKARARLRTKKRADYRAEVQARLLAAVGVTDDRCGNLAGEVNRPNRPTSLALPRLAFDLDDERVNTSTQKLRFAAEMLIRIGEQGITAGLLGDPPPGRSALDERRGIVATEAPTLASRLSNALKIKRRNARHRTDKPQPVHT